MSADLVRVMRGVWVPGIVTVDWAVIGAPVGGLAEAVAELTIWPRSTSAWVVV